MTFALRVFLIGLCGIGAVWAADNERSLEPNQRYHYAATVVDSDELSVVRLTVSAEAPSTDEFDATTYYGAIGDQTGLNLKSALYSVITDHNVRDYRDLWRLYAETGRDQFYDHDHSIVDIYSELADQADPYNYRGSSQQCRGTTINREGFCYNREHIFPRSWFDDEDHPAFSDAHHIMASDAFVNSLRSNFPHGDVDEIEEQSLNGSLLGSSAASGFTGTVFEPIDEFKGDIARAYFYMATRYENDIASWRFNNSRGADALAGNSGSVYQSWFIAVLLRWHNADPVSDYERARNQAVYDFQGNRNPFIDRPSWVNAIWE